MKCKCMCILHGDSGCEVETLGECGDLCQICFRTCEHIMKNGDLIKECKHNNVVKVRRPHGDFRERMKNIAGFPDEYIDALIESLNINIDLKLSYCKMCKRYVDPNAYPECDDGRPIIQMNRRKCVCKCEVEFVWTVGDKSDEPTRFFRCLDRCGEHREYDGKNLYKKIREEDHEKIKLIPILEPAGIDEIIKKIIKDLSPQEISVIKNG